MTIFWRAFKKTLFSYKKSPSHPKNALHASRDTVQRAILSSVHNEKNNKSLSEPTISLSHSHDVDDSKEFEPLFTRGINGGDFRVCHRIISPKAFPKKPPKVRRLQLLGMLSVLMITFTTHTWFFLEQHIVRRLLTPMGLVLTGFFLSGSDSHGANKPDQKTDQKDEKSPSPPSEEKKSEQKIDKSEQKDSKESNDSKNSKDSKEKTETTEKNIKSTPISKDEKNQFSAFDPLSLTSAQLKILLSLHERDQNLKKTEENLREKEAAHVTRNAAMDKQLDEKRKELLELKKTVEALAQTSNKDILENVKKMVTIYESMKPEEAAKIFNELPHVVLVGLMKKMNTKKASAILARMNVEKTKAITNTFALAPYIPSGKGSDEGKKK